MIRRLQSLGLDVATTVLGMLFLVSLRLLGESSLTHRIENLRDRVSASASRLDAEPTRTLDDYLGS